MTQKMEWKSEYEIGEPKIDTQHRKIIGLINQLGTCWVDDNTYANLSEILAEMTAYSHEHLSYEEQVLANCDYPELESHTAEHRNYIKQTAKMCMEAVRHTDKAPDQIYNFLVQWWDNHILNLDQLYKPYLKK